MSSRGDFPAFSARLRDYIRRTGGQEQSANPEQAVAEFDTLALELFGLQYRANGPYRQLCQARGVSPASVGYWSEIPAVPTAAFKELDLSCIPEQERVAVFHSSGTTEHQPSRHYHHAGSLAVYEASLLPWFLGHVLPEFEPGAATPANAPEPVMLTPPPEQAPHSSLVHMFEVVRQTLGAGEPAWFGTVDVARAWHLKTEQLVEALRRASQAGRPVMLLGTAFLFVHLLDHLQSQGRLLRLPPGSRLLETGGYKGRSRALPKGELHALLTEWLGIPATHLVCEYGMSELSSQAYDHVASETPNSIRAGSAPHAARSTHHFRFPPWARARLISPETGLEAGEGEPGLIQVLDLANVYSVLAIQTEDLGIKRGDGFELLGRAALAEPRGCSLMAV